MNTRTIPSAVVASKPCWWTCLSVFWVRMQQLRRRAPKRLRLCETLPLGERRLVAVVEFERARFLVGATPSSLSLLARLEDRSGDACREDLVRERGQV